VRLPLTGDSKSAGCCFNSGMSIADLSLLYIGEAAQEKKKKCENLTRSSRKIISSSSSMLDNGRANLRIGRTCMRSAPLALTAQILP